MPDVVLSSFLSANYSLLAAITLFGIFLLLFPIVWIFRAGLTGYLIKNGKRARFLVSLLALIYILLVSRVTVYSIEVVEQDYRERFGNTLTITNEVLEDKALQWLQRATQESYLLTQANFSTQLTADHLSSFAQHPLVKATAESLETENIAILNLDGKPITALHPQPELSLWQRPEARSFLQQVQRSGFIYLPPNSAFNADNAGNFYLLRSFTTAETAYIMLLSFNTERVFRNLAFYNSKAAAFESYLVDSIGRILTPSRFQQQLSLLQNKRPEMQHTIGWLLRDPGPSAELTKHNPAWFSERPLTTLASYLVNQQSGLNVEGYYDYRGETVLGAGYWSQALGFGIATEVDESYALSAFQFAKNIILGVLLSLILITLILMSILLWAGERVTAHLKQAIDQSHANLSSTLEQLKQAEWARSLALEGAAIGLWHADLTNRTWSWDKRVIEIIGNKETPSLRSLHHLISPADQRRLYQQFKQALKNRSTLDTEAVFFYGGNPQQPRFVRIKATAAQGSNGHLRIDGILQDVTAVKATTSSLQQIREHHQLILNSAGEGIIGLDLQGAVTFCNKSALQLLQYNEQELVGHQLHAMVHFAHEDGSAYHQDNCFMLLAAKDDREYLINNEVLWRKDGTAFPVEYTAKPLKENNEITGSVIVFRDISERREQQRQLEIREKEVTTILEASPDPLIIVDDQARIVTINQRTETVFKYSREQLIGQPIEMLLPERFRNGHISLRNAYICQPYARTFAETSNRQNFWALDATGHEFPIELSLNPVHTEQGLFIISAIHDISERLKAEQVLRESEARLQAAAAAAELGLWEFFPAKAEVLINNYWLTMLGYPEHNWLEAASGRNSKWFRMIGGIERGLSLIHLNDVIAVKNTFKSLIIGEIDSFRLRYRMQTASGEWRWVMAAGQVIERDAQRKAIRMVGISSDVHDETILEQQLREARDIAEQATQTKSAFLANMSHEIRTPMNAIIGMSHLALNTDLSAKQRNYIEKVHQSAKSLLGIINDILDFSKIEAGRMQLEAIEFQLESVLENVATLTVFKAENKDLELLFSLQPAVPVALIGDPMRLGQVLTNLVSNAVKFTDKGEIVVSVSVNQQLATRCELLFSVKDSGIGLNPAQQSQLFQSFSQADNSTTRRFGGTGLGLAISKNLVELMNGQLWVESIPNMGSTFYFTAEFELQTLPIPVQRVTKTNFSDKRACVVDDNLTATDILSTMVKQLGFEVESFVNAESALLRLQDLSLPVMDLLLIDWKMPGMDGLELVKALQQLKMPLPKIILVTAYGREDAIDRARELPIQAFISKPITPSTLLDTIMPLFGQNLLQASLNSLSRQQPSLQFAALAGARILLVEDNEINLELAKELLTSQGLDVTVARNGLEAIQKLQEATFDGVLMDCQMPVMDGYTATRQIRQQAGFQQLPIIAMTANTMEGDREKAIASGMNDHIPKPLDVVEMFNTIARWIKNPSYTQSSPVTLNNIEPLNNKALALLTGVDVSAGLQRTMQNLTLYTKLLSKTQQHYYDFLTQYQQLASEPEAQIRLVHSLKGVAGNIGASRLHAACEQLEHALRQQSSTVDALLQHTNMALTEVIIGINAFLATLAEQDRVATVNEPLDLEMLKTLLLSLLQAAQEFDTAASALLEPQLRNLEAFAGKKIADSLQATLNRYDFENAAVLLQQLLHKLQECQDV